MKKQERKSEKSGKVRHKILTVIGIVLCIVLIPVLILNVTLIIKSYADKDKVPSVGGYMPLIVLTDSMYPEIKSGDLIICRTADADEIKSGDIISFFDPEENGTSIVTHRVEEVISDDGELSFRTKGDANNTADRQPVPEDKLVGTYITRIAGAGNVAMFMQTTPGLIVCVAVPLVLLIGYDVIRRRMYEKSKKQDADALLAELEALKAEKAKKAENDGDDR